MKRFITAIIISFLIGCAPARPSIRPGVIPEAHPVSKADEEYGYEVAYQISQQYPLDDRYENTDRVRKIVERLSRAANADNLPWKIYVYRDESMKNAAATRGNFIFVWTGMLHEVQNDGELATVLSHEFAHVLAGHTESNPNIEAKSIMAGVAGSVAKEVLAMRGLGVVGQLAEVLVAESIKAFAVNPMLREKELDADRIGLFLMAEAGYDPRDAIEFWRRASTDPDFSASDIQFISTHPSTVDRLSFLEEMLPLAEERYFEVAKGIGGKSKSKTTPSKDKTPLWRVRANITPVRAKPSSHSKVVGELKRGDGAEVVSSKGNWLEISYPFKGFVREDALEAEERFYK